MKPLKSTPFTTISILTVFALCFGLIIIRWINIFNPDVYVISKAINSHITNFTISLLLSVLIGYFLLTYGKGFLSVLIVGGAVALANGIYELCLPILNTCDSIDALYGLAGVAVSLAYLYLLDKIGFEKE